MTPNQEFDLKPLNASAVQTALEKAMRYRLLNEPAQAESICLDILALEPDNSEAIHTMLLALTDRSGTLYSVGNIEMKDLVDRLASDYERFYFKGIILEREGQAYLRESKWGGKYEAFEKLTEAMDWYEKAEKVRPEHNDDAILRWNTCVRIIQYNGLEARPPDDAEHFLE